MDTLVWFVPLLPLFGFVANAFAGRHFPKTVVSVIGCGTVIASAVIAWIVFLHVASTHHALESAVHTWIKIPGLDDKGFLQVIAQHKLVADPLTCIMILVVTNVGALIHVYSTGYMAEDARYARYFAFLNLFTFFMLILVMGGNLLLMFVGWEGVGLCSYLLIGFWFEKRENAIAGMKAFIVNRVGDFAFTVGVLLLFVYLGGFGAWTLDFGEIQTAIRANEKDIAPSVLNAVGILLFIGATGKSAQIPLYTWLPDAMAGPTPVSALIHAATMVTAGVYMVARMHFLYAMAPWAMTVVAVVGAATALYAGTIGCAQNDIKKVLAYSTVSQLGFMFMGVGVGAYAAGIFHLMTHAFFKACLFLGSGSVIHGMGGEQDIRKMGGLRRYMPVTFLTFLVATLAIAGFPLLAGFWSKDEILWRTWSTHALKIPGPVVWLLGAVAAAFTAFYMMRLLVLTFFGELRTPPVAHAYSGGGVDDAHAAPGHDAGHGHKAYAGTPHESPPSMTVPLVVLAALSVVGGFVGMGAWTFLPNWFEHFLAPVFGAHEARASAMEYALVVVSIGIALAGLWFGWHVYETRKGMPAKAWAEQHRQLHELVRDKYRVDELYQSVVVEPLLELNEAIGRFDNGVVDGAVNATASGGATVSNYTGYFDNEVVDGGVNATGYAVQATGRSIRRLQTGNIKAYLTSAVVGGLIVIGAYCMYLKWDSIEHTLKRLLGS